MTVDELTVDEMTVDDLTWYPLVGSGPVEVFPNYCFSISQNNPLRSVLKGGKFLYT